MTSFFTLQFVLLTFAGVLIGVFSVVVGGGFFISIPFIQWLFPQVSVGAVVGNLKVGSFFRSIGSTLSTFKQIEFLQNLKIMPPALIGTVLGAMTISNIDQRWLLPAIISAIIFTLQAPKWASKVSNKGFALAAFITGIYSGVLGAGIGIMLVALLRLKHPKDTEIIFVKIQARFVEFMLTTAAVLTHMISGNLITALWIPLAIGGVIGGYVGGEVLNKFGQLSGRTQKNILYSAFAVDLMVASKKFFE